jgi:glycosyltransferase involved in cell wall biosynthesis
VRIAVVCQRYGREILGGAETHAALMAGILARRHDVEVATTTAGDYETWSDAYPAGVSRVDGIAVRRFAVQRRRVPEWSLLAALLHEGFAASEFAHLPQARRERFAERVRAWPDLLQEAFIRGQGPDAPGLVAWLREARHDAVLFVTYLYPTTYDGLAAVAPGRALVVPTLHDEPPAWLPVVGRRLARARLLCSTDAEIALANRLWPESPVTATRIGYGIDLPRDDARVVRGEGEREPFLLYAGRIDVQKGVADLVDAWALARATEPAMPRLVLIGDGPLVPPRLPGLEWRGRVSEGEKLQLMREALALVHPSPFESLGIVVLEAFACRTPILVTDRCPVLVEHCQRSGAGLWWRDAAQLAAAARRLAVDPGLRDAMGAEGRAFVEREWTIDAYAERLLAQFEAPF